jgi:hypothetical protein
MTYSEKELCYLELVTVSKGKIPHAGTMRA